ncbi:hypothetical protein LIPSTDRAFT_73935 [Lipomyces starkeyi NRRL Y-11557]|uniref:Uncharacterized protein n=1 Tax=Lipomyces starkeyi NRRL Y-11557 TaxID=675824 RepID=A0A1E3Q165_LIPST|nr:hypothetical protein LIPSTDRAFT_73935 [Lipomyces starkeyi NRRL Y-11557]
MNLKFVISHAPSFFPCITGALAHIGDEQIRVSKLSTFVIYRMIRRRVTSDTTLEEHGFDRQVEEQSGVPVYLELGNEHRNSRHYSAACF